MFSTASHPVDNEKKPDIENNSIYYSLTVFVSFVLILAFLNVFMPIIYETKQPSSLSSIAQPINVKTESVQPITTATETAQPTHIPDTELYSEYTLKDIIARLEKVPVNNWKNSTFCQAFITELNGLDIYVLSDRIICFSQINKLGNFEINDQNGIIKQLFDRLTGQHKIAKQKLIKDLISK